MTRMHFDIKAVFVVVLFMTTLRGVAGRHKHKHSTSHGVPNIQPHIDIDRLSDEELSYLYDQLSEGSKTLPVYVRDVQGQESETGNGNKIANGVDVLPDTNADAESSDDVPKQQPSENTDVEEENKNTEGDITSAQTESESDETVQPSSEQTAEIDTGLPETESPVNNDKKKSKGRKIPRLPSKYISGELGENKTEKIKLSDQLSNTGDSFVTENPHMPAKPGEQEFANKFDQLIDQEMDNMLKETNADAHTNKRGNTDETIKNKATAQSNSKNKYSIIQRVADMNGQKIRKQRLILELRALCGIHLSMCNVLPRATLSHIGIGNGKPRTVSQQTTPKPELVSASLMNKTQKKNDPALEKLLLFTLRRLRDMEQAKTSRTHTRKSNCDCQQNNTDNIHQMEPVAGHSSKWSGHPVIEDPKTGSVVQPVDDTSRPYMGDKAVWIGILVGTGVSWVLMLLMYVCYRFLLHYRNERQNEQLQKLCNREAHDDNQMHIKMSKMTKNKNGNHYVVSIMNDKKDEDGWSSEEEVFNVSQQREPATSTPVGTPIKKHTGLK